MSRVYYQGLDAMLCDRLRQILKCHLGKARVQIGEAIFDHFLSVQLGELLPTRSSQGIFLLGVRHEIKVGGASERLDIGDTEKYDFVSA